MFSRNDIELKSYLVGPAVLLKSHKVIVQSCKKSKHHSGESTEELTIRRQFVTAFGRSQKGRNTRNQKFQLGEFTNK